MLIENVKGVSTQLKRKTFRKVERLLQTDIKITIARLPEVLNAPAGARVEVKAVDRFERRPRKERLGHIEIVKRLREWGCTWQQSWNTPSTELSRHIAIGRGDLKRDARLDAVNSVECPTANQRAIQLHHTQ